MDLSRLTLQRNVNFLYESRLARLELRAFGCTDLETDEDDDNTVLRAHVNGQATAILTRSAYIGEIDGAGSVYSELIRPAYQGGRFNRTRSVNQYLTHWIYPYRGKFHPQMVRALFNVLGVRAGSHVLEPYTGSGTAALEASLLGAHCVALDLSPLCVLLTKVKTGSWRRARAIRACVETLIKDLPLPHDVDPTEESDPVVADFLQIARMVTYSDEAKRGRDARTAFRKNLLAMLESIEAHGRAVHEFKLEPGKVRACVGDARCLAKSRVAESSIDACVTSPPYSIALDYVTNDEHALDALGVDTRELRDTMTGVRGTSAREKLALYNADMQRTFREIARVLRPGGSAALVIGDATVDKSEYTTRATMIEWAKDAGLTLDRNVKKVVFGLYNVMLDESILIFRKP
jgi:16S rRNA G966 N2-methylase RsmD